MTDTAVSPSSSPTPHPAKLNGNGTVAAADMTKSADEPEAAAAKSAGKSDTAPAHLEVHAPETDADSAASMASVSEYAPTPSVKSKILDLEDDEEPAPTHSAAAAADATPVRKVSTSALELSDVPPPNDARTIERDAPASPSSSPSRRPRLAAVDTATAQALVPESPSARHAPDSPTTSLIASLRQQLELVSDQAQQLNAKLVTSISRHADLEDQIFTLQEEKEHTASTVKELQHAKAQWEESMNTGLLVERDQITAEMQRLAAGLVEEERKRGTAEEDRARVESEVDDLAASLFDQANTMVATERMSRAQAEERLKASQDNLAVAEAAVRDMQLHLQTLSASSETQSSSSIARMPLPRRILSSHPPYAEFVSFIQHLRAARPRTQRSRDLYPAPYVQNLLAQPFLARCILEDHDPTLRLDAAPDLGWVSRRSVGQAIISGDLLIEPVGVAALGPVESANCALCGRHVHGQSQGTQSRFSLNKIFSSPTTSASAPAHSTVYVFRTAGEREKLYPLCRNGWCLERLRAACALWHFIRTGVVGRVWSSEDVQHSRQTSAASVSASASTTPTTVKSSLASRSGSISTVVGDEPRGATPAHSIVAPSPTRSTQYTPSASPSPAQPEPRKKSPWGIGGWGWSSRPSTPLEKPNSEEDQVPTALVSPIDLKHAPTAPSPLAKTMEIPSDESEKVDEKEAVKAEENEDEKAEKAVETKEERETAHDEKEIKKENGQADKSALAPPRPDSRASHSGSEASFATPEATPILAPVALKDPVEDDKPTTPEAEKDAEKKAEDEKPADGSATPKADAERATDKSEDKPADASPASSAPASPADNTPVPSSPTKTSAPSPAPSPRPPARAAGRGAPPPLPKRAAARNSVILTSSEPVTPTQASTNMSAAATPTAASPKKAEEKIEEKEEEVKTEEKKEEVKVEEKKEEVEVEVEAEAEAETEAEAKADKPAEAEEKKDEVKAGETAAAAKTTEAAAEVPASEKEDGQPKEKELALAVDSDVPPTNHTEVASAPPEAGRPAPPPLPPRRDTHASAPTSPVRVPPPRTPISAPIGSLQEEQQGKTFATGDNWEVRAWRQIISLKEDMWRTRVGVIDDEA